ncbi:hypothetical protein ABZX90_31365 [Streptomyces sp. NPDC002935]|uniref:hypothetical protein n=1 Tax=Streptomyces sp. NPDC002935 TaxID=3154545 RepID=UPI0033A48007
MGTNRQQLATLTGDWHAHQELPVLFAQLERWSRLAAVNRQDGAAATIDIFDWIDEGKQRCWFPTSDGKIAAAPDVLWPGIQHEPSFVFEAKASHAPSRRGFDYVPLDEIRPPLPFEERTAPADDRVELSGALLTRALSLFTSLAGLQDWLDRRRTVRLRDADEPLRLVPDAVEPLSLACGVRRLAVPLVPRAPGVGRPGVIGLGDYVLGA